MTAPHAAAAPPAAWAWLAGYSAVIVVASLVGGWLPGKLRLTHARLQHVISLVAGLMLGVATLHLLPHAAAAGLSVDDACRWALGGVVAMFLLLRALHFHVHEPAPLVDADPGGPEPVKAHECDAPGHAHEHGPGSRLGWAGMFLGMAVHTLADGAALGAGLAAAMAHGVAAGPPALGIAAAVALHKPLDAMSVTALMRRDGWSGWWQASANGAIALLCPLGAALALWGQGGGAAGPLLAFSAGVFLCIALADLLPEMEFHSHDRFTLTVALLGGIALAVAVGWLEPPHAHG